jgi:hypothetical protein
MMKCVTGLALWYLIVSEFHIMNVNFPCRLKTGCELQGQGWTGINFFPPNFHDPIPCSLIVITRTFREMQLSLMFFRVIN